MALAINNLQSLICHKKTIDIYANRVYDGCTQSNAYNLFLLKTQNFKIEIVWQDTVRPAGDVTAPIWSDAFVTLVTVIGRGCLTWVPGRPSICVTRLRLIYSSSLRGPSPQALNLLGRARFIPWHLKRLFRGMPMGPEAFLESPSLSELRPNVWYLHLKRPCTILVFFHWSLGYDQFSQIFFLDILAVHKSLDGFDSSTAFQFPQF